MVRQRTFIRTVIWAVVAVTFAMAWLPPLGQAMLAPTTPEATATDSGGNRAADLQTVQRALENKLIQQRLEDLGLTADEINARLSRLPDAQLHQMAAQVDALTPGGDAGLGIVVALLVIAILVVVLIYLLGHHIEVKKN